MASDAENNDLLKRNIMQYLKNHEKPFSEFGNQIKYKDVIIFLGNTRSGKSTLVNYMIDSKLEGFKLRDEFKIKVKGTDKSPIIGQGSVSCTTIPGVCKIRESTDDGPEIGQGSLSCTASPSVYKMEGSTNVVLVDPPGFGDNRGVVQDIINAFCISQINCARTVKFVLVVDINDITGDNIGKFTDLLDHFQDPARNFNELKKSFSFIFTKDSRKFSQEEIIELLRKEILNQDQLDMNKTLVQNLVENKQLIGIFKMPTQEGEISNELDVNVKDAIKECRKVDMEKCEIMIAFSEQAHEALLQIYLDYTDTYYFKKETDKIIAKYNDYFNIDKYVFASYNEELETTETDLKAIALNLKKHRKENRTHLFEIQKSLDELLELSLSTVFKASFEFVIMLDGLSMLEQKYKEMITRNYVRSLSNLHTKVTRLLEKIDAELSERKNNNFIFRAACVAGVAGGLTAVGAMGKVLHFVVKTGSIHRVASISGAAAGTVFGFGVGSAIVLHQQTEGKRNDARRRQGRSV